MNYNSINIKDEEIEIIEDEFFDSLKYVEQIKEKLKNNNFFNVIGLYGAWGSGKSSIIKTIIKHCKNEYLFVEYDAWKHNEDSIKRSFLVELMEKTQYSKKEDIKSRLYEETTVENEITEKYLFIKEIILIALFVIFAFIVKKTITYALILTSIGYSVKVIDRYTEKSKIFRKRFPIKSTEEYEKIYKKIINEVAKEKRVIIIIDNLDRCTSDISYKLLTSLKTFMSNEEKVTVIIPLDEDAIKSHIKKSLYIEDSEVNEYLIKIINSSISIKEPSSEKIYKYIVKLCEDNKIAFKEQTKDVISETGLSNPRKIISFINNLCNELNLFNRKYDKLFLNNNEHIIAILLFIRTNFESYYRYLKEYCKGNNSDFDYNFYKKTNEIELTKKENFIFSNTVEYIVECPNDILFYIINHEETMVYRIEEDNDFIEMKIDKLIEKYKEKTLLDKGMIHLNLYKDTHNFEKSFNNFFKFLEICMQIILKSEENYKAEKMIRLLKTISAPYGTENSEEKIYELLINKNTFVKLAYKYYKTQRKEVMENLIEHILVIHKNTDIVYSLISIVDDEIILKKIGETFIENMISEMMSIQSMGIDKKVLKLLFTNEAFQIYTDAFIGENISTEDYIFVLSICDIYDYELAYLELDNTKLNLIEYIYCKLVLENPYGDLRDLNLFSKFLKNINDVVEYIDKHNIKKYENKELNNIMANILDRITDSLSNENKKEVYEISEKNEIIRFNKIYKNISQSSIYDNQITLIENLLMAKE